MSELTPIIKDAFTQYSGAVLQSRALVDARDCVKPSARQIFFSMLERKLIHKNPYKKTANAVGMAMADYYIHGDASATGIIMRAAQPFSMRYPLVDTRGNKGTLIESGNWAAQRYTESRLGEVCEVLFRDIDKETIEEWRDNYENTKRYPSVLPSKGFYNIVNGSLGIGTGLASSIPQFNLKEVNEALIKLLWNPDVDFDSIYCAPDFATGAILLNEEEVKQSLREGKGKSCRLRSVVDFDKKDRCLVVTEIPYGLYTNTICSELDAVLEDAANPGIDRYNDLTGAAPLIKIYLNKGANPDKVLRYLYKNTSLQNYYGINMTMLDEGRFPKVFNWKEALQAHLKHEENVYRRGFQYDLNKILHRLHIIEGLIKAIDAIDEVVETIKKSASTVTANTALQKLLSIDEEQAKAILDIKLARLARLEINKLADEQKKLNIEKERIEKILSNESLLKKEIEKGLREVATKYGDDRRTKIMNLQTSGDEDEPIEIRQLVVNATNEGNLYVEETSSLYTQKRGKVGNKFKLSEGESIISTITCQSNDNIFLFTNKGNYYSLEAKELPVGSYCSIHSFVNVKTDEKLCALSTFSKDQFVYFVTKNGYIKKSKANEYSTGRKSGAKAITLGADDKIVSVLFGEGVLALTSKSNILLVDGKKINPIGRIGRGIAGMKLNDGDEVVCAALQPAGAKTLIVLTKSGKIKQVERKILSIQGSGTKGRRIVAKGEETASFCFYTNEKDVLISTTSSQIKIAVKDIPSLDTTALGNKAIELKSGMECIGVSVDN